MTLPLPLYVYHPATYSFFLILYRLASQINDALFGPLAGLLVDTDRPP